LLLPFTILSFILYPLSLPSAQRVVSLVPSVTEIIYALGAEDKLVGVVTPCDYPLKIDKPIVGTFSLPSLERIYTLKPDLVFVEDIEQKYLWAQLKKLNIRIDIASPQSIEEVYEAIENIGDILNKRKRADSLVNSMRCELDSLQKMMKGVKRRRVFIEIAENPLMTVGNGSFMNELIEAACAINIAENINIPYPIVNQESVIKANPDIIVVAHKGGTNPAKRSGWDKIDAVRNRRVYQDIDPNLLMRPGPRIIKGVRALMERMYPERF
jgi:iron complex transport system substrate-binding protein